jgi:hypothetical protein
MEQNHIIPFTINTEYCHNGIPLSNGIFGALVWFQRGSVFVTVNRADLWDRRGGTEWTDDCTFARLRSLLVEGDFEAVRGLFKPGMVNGKSKRPTRLPLGRFEIALSDGYAPRAAQLDVSKGEVRVVLAHPEASDREMRLAVLIDDHALVIDCPVVQSVTPVPAYEFPAVREYFQDFSIPVPRTLVSEGTGSARGWVQDLPEDPGAAVLLGRYGSVSVAVCELDDSEDSAEKLCAETLSRLAAIADSVGYAALTEPTHRRFAELYRSGATVRLGDERLERMYYLGIYKMLGNSMPGRIAPTLQGPWVEEHRMPPWSGDYHFNINVQECLWPAYASGHHGALLPLFSMLESFKPVLRERARTFAGVDDGLQMSHACDDRGTTIGGFWTGAIDHANTSWVAQMMWLYYRYTGDIAFLEDTALPFLVGAFRVFRAFMEETEHGPRLPVTVSPEYGGSGDDAWGANSSFFLTNLHFVCEKLLECATLLPQADVFADDSFTREVRHIQEAFPLFTTGEGAFGREIYLWENQPLEHSHRHHSHLAALYPFDMVDPAAEDCAELLSNSYRTWAHLGMGEWTGWAMPWAAILHARMGNPEMAIICLRILSEVFTMPGYGTRHNAIRPGFSMFFGGDVMQVEAGIAFSAAVLELFVQNVRGRVRLFVGVPDSMTDCGFEGIVSEGGFEFSGSKQDGAVQPVTIVSTRGGSLTIENPWAGEESGAAVAVHRRDGSEDELVFEHSGDRISFETEVGARYVLRKLI